MRVRDPALTGDRRRALFEALMRLSDLDGACELVTGETLLGIDRALGLRVTAGPPAPARTAYRPLDAIRSVAVQDVARREGLPLVSSRRVRVGCRPTRVAGRATRPSIGQHRADSP